MRRRLDSLVAVIFCLAAVSCGRQTASDELNKLTSDFVYSALALSPVAATGAGYHEHQGAGLDGKLDDWSETGMARQRQFLASVRQRLAAISREQLPPEERADYDILQDQIALSLLDLDTIQSWRHNPTFYVELIGNALFSPFVLDYAPKVKRFRHIIGRLEKIPAFLETAKRNLADSPEVWNRVAREENEGNLGLIEKTLAAEVPPELRDSFAAAAGKAIESLRGFNRWLETDLASRTSDWRLGKDAYARKVRYALGISASPEELLQDAEASLDATRKKMLEIATPLYEKWHSSAKGGSLNHIVGRTLARISGRHATVDTYFASARRDLDEAGRFVRDKKLLALPGGANLQVIETPEFMRGIYAVGGFNAAPPLEPQLGAFYWLTPIPKTWPAARIESKLREYNTYGLKLLTIHEAMPGHYVQLEYSNRIQPIARRLLRSVFGSGPYVEGWAVYVTEVMLEEGYLDNSPELRLVFLKQQLRMIANTILDVRMQTMNMTDAEAMRLMLESAFQESEEAGAKLQRAQLSSAQLPTYYAGYREWMRIRNEYMSRQRSRFHLSEFHERALRAGAVSMRSLAELLE
ncbi:MAG: DUF885 domain-containing protein [Acidobacteria bacterium]|nr:DUF885 domain-containing protein [Acidobacteriota bacterium]